MRTIPRRIRAFPTDSFPAVSFGSVCCIAAFVFLGAGWSALAFEIDELQQRASWQHPDVGEVQLELERWLETQDIDSPTRLRIETTWNIEEGSQDPIRLLERLVATVALAHPDARPLATICESAFPPSSVEPVEWLENEELPGIVRNNLRLFYGRWLAQQAYYDEALQQIGELKHDDVVDPATLLFYQSVIHHRLLHRQECLDCIAKLLENADFLPRRYVSVACLMEADIKPLKQDSLDEIARMMENVQRRLRLGRAGTRVRKEEDDVVAKLDKMIEEKERQQQQQQQKGAGGSQGSNRSSSPAQDSTPLGGSGPGDVDQKPIGNTSDWGNLPPKKRQEALQQISKDLPSHYREVIEEYFRRLAQDVDR